MRTGLKSSTAPASCERWSSMICSPFGRLFLVGYCNNAPSSKSEVLEEASARRLELAAALLEDRLRTGALDSRRAFGEGVEA